MSTVQEDMENVTVRILTDWAMMLVERADDWQEVFKAEEKYFVGRVEFRGVVRGTFRVICQEGFARALTANLLGADVDATEVEMRDAVCEMINVLSGNLLTSSYGEDTVFDLRSPCADLVDHEEICRIMKGFTLAFTADDEPLAVIFTPEKLEHDD